jgi:membrane fusion protein, copper/silver efflux system
MKRKPIVISLIAAVVLGAAGYGVYIFGMQRGMSMTAAPAGATAAGDAARGAGPQSVEQGEEATRRHIAAGLKAGDTDPATGKKILYYHDPMVPGNKFDKPAKSPFMNMMLVPVYADSDFDSSKVTVSPRTQQNLGVRTALVAEGMLLPQVSAVGNIAYNERDQAIVQARATGFVERLYVRATLDRVAKGQSLVDLYVPDWISAQEEFLSVRRMQGTELASLIDGARQRMRLAGMNEQQIRLVESTGRTQPRITLTAPIGGVLAELMVREGMTVMPGATIARISGLSTVWAQAEVPESQSALLRPGTKVQALSPAVPGTTFHGTVQAIVPEVTAATRTFKARVELANHGGRLVPGMFVTMQFMDTHTEKSLLIPSEAIIQTGTRTVVMLAEDNGAFRPIDVEIGIESGGQTEIKRGLQVGQHVVVSSQFLIDSEASLKGVEARLNAEPKLADAAARHTGTATVESIDRDAVTLSHGPIQSLKWSAMTMEFKLGEVGKTGQAKAIAPGDRVRFSFHRSGEDFVLDSIEKVNAEQKK